ncbi:MAG: FmdB family zinc ribbon protein [Pyrinomonadaceae bacterium]
MPIYEYKCLGCEKRVEKMQKISDAPLTVCENCGGKLEKQVSRAGFQFKGAGWYVTDYANKGKPETETKTEGRSETASDSEKKSSAESTVKPDSASKQAETKTTSKE